MTPSVPRHCFFVTVALAAGLVLCAGCVGDSLSVLAGNCWGQGSPDCREDQNPVLRALGYEGAELGVLISGFTCGETVDCRKVAARPKRRPAAPARRPASTSVASSAANPAPVETKSSVSADSGASDASAEPSGGGAVVADVADTSAGAGDGSTDPATTPQAEPEPLATEEKVAAIPASSAACKGIDIASLEQRSEITSSEQACLMDAALGKAGVSDPDIQVAVISLYNTRSTGWKKAVEAALSRKNLANAPNLNFAGIKPAYDGTRYRTVIRRSNIVWRNLKKGYSLTADHLTFVTEFACRSGLQLHLMQKPDPTALDWCERWRSRLSKAGASTADVDDILDQLEE